MREAMALITPAMSPLKGSSSSITDESGAVPGENRWRNPNGGGAEGSAVNAVSFGFVATAILISMFLFMALFEHFLRPRGDSTAGGDPDPPRRRRIRWWWRREGADLEANKLGFITLEVPVYAKEVSVLMPGQNVPTYIANPMPNLPLNPPSSSCSNPNIT